MKSATEIKKRLRDLVNRHRKQFIKRHMGYIPSRCEIRGMGVDGCRCMTELGNDGFEVCTNRKAYDCPDQYDALNESFAKDVKNPEILTRDYRDIAMLLWVLELFESTPQEEPPVKVDKIVPAPQFLFETEFKADESALWFKPHVPVVDVTSSRWDWVTKAVEFIRSSK